MPTAGTTSAGIDVTDLANDVREEHRIALGVRALQHLHRALHAYTEHAAASQRMAV
jgi:hypothetical protein